jgi:cellulose synthase/poly-beta-1,6-N-acetylglucosamine synthase-like glycosyltransferase
MFQKQQFARRDVPTTTDLAAHVVPVQYERMSRSNRTPWGAILFVTVLLIWLSSFCLPWAVTGIARWTAGILYVAYDTWLIVYVALALYDWRIDGATESATDRDSPGPSIAVVISARNEAAVLPATLEALLAQDDRAEEIWVVDDGSDDDTLAMLSRRYPSLRVITKPNTGKADSLNLGINSSGSELVITLDADTVLRSDAVGAMRRAFQRDSQLVAAGGVLIPRCVAGVSGRIFEYFQTYEYIREFIARVAWMRANALLLVSGAFACYRRSALVRVGGFETRSWVEDYELTHRLHRFAHDHDLSWHVGVLPEAAAITDAPASPASFLRQRRRWFGGFLQTLFSYRDMIGNARYATVGRLMLPLKVLDTLAPLFGITALILFAIFFVEHDSLAMSIASIIAIKVGIDMVFLLWGVTFYSRWSGRRSSLRQWLMTGLAALTEPLFFQWLRLGGALLGWFAVLRQRTDWIPQRSTNRVQPLSTEP